MSQNQPAPAPANETLTSQQALSIMNEICAKYMGTRADHITLEKAIATLAPLVAKDMESKTAS